MLDELKKLFKHTTIYGMGNVFGKMVGFVMIPFYTHYLTPVDYGTLELLDLTLSLTGLVLTMWMNASIIRHYHEFQDDLNRSQVIGTILIMAAAIGVVVATLGISCARPLSSLILKTPDFHAYIRLISLSFLVSCLNAVSWSYLRANEQSVFVVSTDLLNLTLTLGLNIYFIAYLKIGVIGVLYSGLISSTVITVILTINTLRQVSLQFSFEKLKAIVAFGAPLVITSAAAFTVNFSDRFFLRHFSTISDVGIYALGYKFGFMLSFLVVQPFDMIWGARMYEIAKQDNAGDVISRIFSYYSLALIATALGMSLIIKEVISVIAAPNYHGAYKIVPIVALAYVFQGMNRYFLSGIYIAKRTIYLGGIGGTTAALNLILNYFLIGRFGMIGAAWATAFSFFAMAALAYLAAQKVHPIPYSFSRLLMPLALATLLYLASTAVFASLVLSVALKLVILLLFPVGLYLIGFFDKREVEKARELGRLFLVRYGLRAAAASGRG
jgi:O-antigen/teichoic acid export membrane protein